MRRTSDFNRELSDTFNRLSIGTKYKVIGSASLQSTLYINDYDIFEYFKSNESNALTKITQHFKKLFSDTYKNPHKWITDFKCGYDPNYRETEDGWKLRWDRHDIQRGYKILRDGSHKYFKDCILDKTTMKIDYVVLLNGLFYELSENYDITIGGHSNTAPVTSIESQLKKDIKKYKDKGDKFKSLKREFSLLRITNPKSKRIQKLIDLFNGSCGYLNKIINELMMIQIMMEQTFRPVKLSDLLSNLQIIKQQLSFFMHPQIDRLTKEEIFGYVSHLIPHLKNRLNSMIKI
jgi:hypothetical protein